MADYDIKRIPIKDHRQEEGAHELASSPGDFATVRELLKLRPMQLAIGTGHWHGKTARRLAMADAARLASKICFAGNPFSARNLANIRPRNARRTAVRSDGRNI